MKLFSFEDEKPEPVTEFREATIIQTSGTSSTTDTTEVNILPIANAGSNQTVVEFEDVMLDGSSSTDVDGTIVSYNWTQVSGPTTVILKNNDTVKATFEAPHVDGQGIFEFMLAVVDNSNGTDIDKVKVTVNEKDDGPVDDPPNDKDEKNKVTICHIPQGNPDNSHTITVGESAVLAHVAHGDTLDSCEENEGNENKKGNSGKGNQNNDDEEKSNSGKNNKDDNENKKGNSGVNNSGKGNQNNDDEKKSNSKLNNNDDTKDDDHDDRDDEHEDEDEKDKDRDEDDDD